jgi:hypothetical protein
MTPEQIRHARDLPTRPNNTVSSIAVSRSTIYNYIPELDPRRHRGNQRRSGRGSTARPRPHCARVPGAADYR